MSASCERELVVTRTAEKGANVDTSVTFTPTVFSRGEKNKLGIKYPGFPVIDENTLQVAVDFFGNENFFSMLNEAIRLWVQQVYGASVVEGVFQDKMFVEFMSELSTRGETKEEIEQKQAELRAQIISLSAEAENASPEELPALFNRLGAISKEIKKYEAIMASKKRVPRAKVQEEEQAA